MVRAVLILLVFMGANVKADLQVQYDRWTKAYMAFDVETLDDILAPDYVLVNVVKEETSRDKYMAYLKLRKELHQDTMKYSSKIKKVEQQSDDAAVVIDVETQELLVDGKRVLHRHEYRDSWARLDGKWKLRRTETLKESTQVKASA